MFQNQDVLPEYLVYVSSTCKKWYFTTESKTWFFCLKVTWGGVKVMIILQGEMFLEYAAQHTYQICIKFSFSCSAFEWIYPQYFRSVDNKFGIFHNI